jgi:hypothetical protein
MVAALLGVPGNSEVCAWRSERYQKQNLATVREKSAHSGKSG